METKANYVLIGAFTIAVAIFGLLFALWAAKYSSEKSFREYDVIFNEPVTGLTEGSSVQYNGIAIGTVKELKLAPNDPRQVIARLKLQADAPVKTDTTAKLSMTSLTGSPIIQLTGGDPRSPSLRTTPGREVPVIRTQPSALQNIADTANRLVERMDKVLSEENVKRISDTLAHIESLTGSIAGQREDLRAIIANAREASDQLSKTLATTAISSFANDGLSQLGPTLGELRSLIRDLRRVSDRLDNNPARYLLGRDAPKEFEPK